MPSHIPRKHQMRHRNQQQQRKSTGGAAARNNNNASNSSAANASLDEMLTKVLEYKSQDNRQQALRQAKLARAKFPRSEDALDMLSELLYEMNHLDQCKNLLRQGVQQFSETGAQKFLMLAEMETGEDSKRCYQQAIKIILRDLEMMKQQSNNNQQEILQQLEPMYSALAEAYCAIGELYMTDLSQDPNAEQNCVSALQEAQKYAPTSSHVLQTFASCRISQQKPDEARKLMAQMLQQSPDFADAPDQFKTITGQILMELNMMDEACAIFQALRHEGDLTPQIALLSAVAEKLNNNYFKAFKLLNKILPDVHGKQRSTVKAEISDIKKLGGEQLKEQWAEYEKEQKRLEKEQDEVVDMMQD